MKLGMDGPDLPSPKQTQLQKSIRIQASSFLQDNMLTLQSLPSEEEYSRLQEIHKAKVQKRIAAERQEAMLAQERERRRQDEPKPSSSNQIKDSGHKRSDSRDSVGTGWKPHEEVKRTVVRNADDPMIQQMDIIRGYIKQAKQAMKYDEVDMLEQNLKELQAEYWRQQGAESFQA